MVRLCSNFNRTLSYMESRGHYYKRSIFNISYVMLYMLLFMLCYGIFLLSYHKAFFRNFDGFDQHYISFLYLGLWGRTIYLNLIHGVHPIVPMWSQAIGYGADIPTSLAAYLWDPFNWISVFIPSAYAEQGYAVMIILKFYAAGLAFSILANSRGWTNGATLCGAIIYVFSATAQVGFYQSFFINPLIIFPLLIVGVDRLYSKKKSGLYTAVLAYSFVSYFYFAYMMSILVLLYVVLRIVADYHDRLRNSLQKIAKIILSFLLYSIIAVGISATGLLPSVLVMLHAGRLGLPHYIPVFFDKGYYGGIFLHFLQPFNMLGRDCAVGFGSMALICVIVLFMQKGKYQRIKAEFILMVFALCLPFAGHVMNGMNYTANRWAFAYCLLVACIVTMILPSMKNLNRVQAVIVSCICFVYVILGKGVFSAHGISYWALAGLLLISCGLLFIYPKFSIRLFYQSATVICSLAVIALSFFSYSRFLLNGFSYNTDVGTAYDAANNNGGLPLLNEISVDNGTRLDRSGLDTVNNASWLYDQSVINFYISVYNNDIDLFHKSLALNTNPCNYAYSGLDRRSELEALLGVTHFFVNKDTPFRPIGFTNLEAEKEILINRLSNSPITACSYSADQRNSLFYTFDKAITYDTYEKLKPIERQQALMKAVVLDEPAAQMKLSLSQIENVIDRKTVNYSLFSFGDVQVNNDLHTAFVPSAGGQVVLTFDDITDGEVYLSFKHLIFQNGKAQNYSISAEGRYRETESKREQNVYGAYDIFSGNTYYSHMYGGKTDWIINLGNLESPVNTVVLTFNDPGTYTWDDLDLVVRPVSEVKKNIDQLGRISSPVSVGVNEYSLDVNTNSAKYLFTSVPFSEGWKFYDNGKKVDAQRADCGFMAIRLDGGAHHIVMKYITPGFYTGMVISVISFIIYLALQRKTT